MLHKATRFFRIRQCVAASMTQQDKSGVNPSNWCIENNFCTASDRVLGQIKNQEDDAKAYLRETDIETIKNTCRKYPLFEAKTKALEQYCCSYKRFAVYDYNCFCLRRSFLWLKQNIHPKK